MRKMGDCRSYQGDVTRLSRRSQNRKPPPGFWQSSVPSWEKKFCYLVGSIPWKKILETKNAMSYHENVVQWNDSAGEEAFQNAKKRFWAEINGLPCGISLPDSDIYLDEIDWNSKIDPELLSDLDKKPVVPDEEEKDGKVELLVDPLFDLNQRVVPTGWGDAEEDKDGEVELLVHPLFDLNQPVVPTGWGDAEEDPIRTGPNLGDYDRNVENCDYQWELSYNQGNVAVEAKAWGGREDAIKKSENWEFRRTGRDWGTQNGNCTEGVGWDMSRYKTTRFQGADNQTDHGRRDGRGRKKVDFSYAMQQCSWIR